MSSLSIRRISNCFILALLFLILNVSPAFAMASIWGRVTYTSGSGNEIGINGVRIRYWGIKEGNPIENTTTTRWIDGLLIGDEEYPGRIYVRGDGYYGFDRNIDCSLENKRLEISGIPVPWPAGIPSGGYFEPISTEIDINDFNLINNHAVYRYNFRYVVPITATPTITPTPTNTPTPTLTPTPDFRHPSYTPAPPTPTYNPANPPPTPTGPGYLQIQLGIRPTPTPP